MRVTRLPRQHAEVHVHDIPESSYMEPLGACIAVVLRILLLRSCTGVSRLALRSRIEVRHSLGVLMQKHDLFNCVESLASFA